MLGSETAQPTGDDGIPYRRWNGQPVEVSAELDDLITILGIAAGAPMDSPFRRFRDKRWLIGLLSALGPASPRIFWTIGNCIPEMVRARGAVGNLQDLAGVERALENDYEAASLDTTHSLRAAIKSCRQSVSLALTASIAATVETSERGAKKERDTAQAAIRALLADEEILRSTIETLQMARRSRTLFAMLKEGLAQESTSKRVARLVFVETPALMPLLVHLSDGSCPARTYKRFLGEAVRRAKHLGAYRFATRHQAVWRSLRNREIPGQVFEHFVYVLGRPDDGSNHRKLALRALSDWSDPHSLSFSVSLWAQGQLEAGTVERVFQFFQDVVAAQKEREPWSTIGAALAVGLMDNVPGQYASLGTVVADWNFADPRNFGEGWLRALHPIDSETWKTYVLRLNRHNLSLLGQMLVAIGPGALRTQGLDALERRESPGRAVLPAGWREPSIRALHIPRIVANRKRAQMLFADGAEDSSSRAGMLELLSALEAASPSDAIEAVFAALTRGIQFDKRHEGWTTRAWVTDATNGLLDLRERPILWQALEAGPHAMERYMEIVKASSPWFHGRLTKELKKADTARTNTRGRK